MLNGLMTGLDDDVPASCCPVCCASFGAVGENLEVVGREALILLQEVSGNLLFCAAT